MFITQSYLTLCDPMDCSLLGSSVYGILQARILEWVASPFSRGLPDPGVEVGSLALQANSLPSEPPEKPRRSIALCYLILSFHKAKHVKHLDFLFVTAVLWDLFYFRCLILFLQMFLVGTWAGT